jgi:hypothetical protein
MKTARLLALAGVACLIFGAAAWSQGVGYECGSYVAVCGYYDCNYVASGRCSNGLQVNRLKDETLIWRRLHELTVLHMQPDVPRLPDYLLLELRRFGLRYSALHQHANDQLLPVIV